MAPTFKAFALFLLLALFSAASAQELSPASSPAPSPEAGAADSVPCSAIMIGASLVLSLMAVFKRWNRSEKEKNGEACEIEKCRTLTI
ncbi:hypothetical protein JHK85_035534 [Glycine max]|nr:hypothetical protein JHK85_035534 [Glycine max]KAG4987198.1 hypothetical protein JHK86_034889 [Glycine max]